MRVTVMGKIRDEDARYILLFGITKTALDETIDHGRRTYHTDAMLALSMLSDCQEMLSRHPGTDDIRKKINIVKYIIHGDETTKTNPHMQSAKTLHYIRNALALQDLPDDELIFKIIDMSGKAEVFDNYGKYQEKIEQAKKQLEALDLAVMHAALKNLK